MIKIKLSIFCSFILCPIIYLNADDLKTYEKINDGDSVMTPGKVIKPNLQTINKKYKNSSLYTINQEIEYKRGNCPTDFYTPNGNAIYNISQRFINKFYLNGDLSKTTMSDWMEINESCKGKEQQIVNCPDNYIGFKNQEREVTIINGIYNNGEWYDTLNNCATLITPPLPPPITSPKPLICTPIKPMNFGTLYRCKRPDGTTYYTEEPWSFDPN